MARGIQRKPVTLPWLLAAVLITVAGSVGAAESENILAAYSFDDDNLATGPDTFSIFQYAKGTVRLNDTYVYSGYRSVEISDVAHDGNFPELQGYFPLQKDGTLYFHFSILMTDAGEEFNIGLAGPKGFGLEPDAIAFWMVLREGVLRYYSDSIPKKLFTPDLFTWYDVDVSYDVAAGQFDLIIYEENNPLPVTELYGLPGATNTPGSTVDKFSFIGDLNSDLSNAVYYIDDIVIATDGDAISEKLIAPGRRKLFIDKWNEYRRTLEGQLQCLPFVSLEDITLDESLIGQAFTDQALVLMGKIIDGDDVNPASFEQLGPSAKPLIAATWYWKQGCGRLKEKKFDESLSLFRQALELAPDSRLFAMGEILALAGGGDWEQVDVKLLRSYPYWSGNDRFDVMVAMLGFARRDLGLFYDWWDSTVKQVPEGQYTEQKRDFLTGRLTRTVAGSVDSSTLPEWYVAVQPYLIAEQYFDMLLFSGMVTEAAQFAQEMVAHLNDNQLPSFLWQERMGDAAFLAEDYLGAEQIYMSMTGTISSLGKLSDIYFLLGDLNRERYFREKIYGTLE